jgi:hypothetical protein
MAKVAANQKLYNSIKRQAASKFPPKAGKSNPAANNWVSKQYEQEGGTWVTSIKEVDPKFRDVPAELAKKKKAKIAENIRKKKQSGLV